MKAATIADMRAAQTRHRLQSHPHLQAEAIADHYSKLASMAMDLRKMVDFRRTIIGAASPEIDESIDCLRKQFVEHHRADFGIELAWPNPV